MMTQIDKSLLNKIEKIENEILEFENFLNKCPDSVFNIMALKNLKDKTMNVALEVKENNERKKNEIS